MVAYMPTASTSQLLGNFSSFEPCNANIFSRHTLAGTFTILNKHLVRDLKKLGIWSTNIKDKIIAHNGSVQYIEEIPKHIRDVYKTVWEMSQKTLLEMSADRGQFICHTQSLNVYMEDPTIAKTTALIMYGMKLGLKTISYYTRSRAAMDPIKFSISVEEERMASGSKVQPNVDTITSSTSTSSKDDNNTHPNTDESKICRRTKGENGEVCLSCGG